MDHMAVDPLLTTQELARWTQSDESEVAADPFATEVLEKVSGLARFLGGQPTWAIDTIPFDARMVVLKICKRSYENPTQIKSEGGVGPIGGDSFLDAHALLLDLTDAERATLTKYNEDGDPDERVNSLWVLATTRGPADLQAEQPTLYVGDNQQFGLSGSADPREWMVPMFSPGDPGGDPNSYED